MRASVLVFSAMLVQAAAAKSFLSVNRTEVSGPVYGSKTATKAPVYGSKTATKTPVYGAKTQAKAQTATGKQGYAGTKPASGSNQVHVCPWGPSCQDTAQCLLNAIHTGSCTADLAQKSSATGGSNCMKPAESVPSCALEMFSCSRALPSCWMSIMCYDPCVCSDWKDKNCGTLVRSSATCTWAYPTSASENTPTPGEEPNNTPLSGALAWQAGWKQLPGTSSVVSGGSSTSKATTDLANAIKSIAKNAVKKGVVKKTVKKQVKKELQKAVVKKQVKKAVTKAVKKQVKKAVDKVVKKAATKAVAKAAKNPVVKKAVKKVVKKAVKKAVPKAVKKAVPKAVKKAVPKSSASRRYTSTSSRSSRRTYTGRRGYTGYSSSGRRSYSGRSSSGRRTYESYDRRRRSALAQLNIEDSMKQRSQAKAEKAETDAGVESALQGKC